MAHSPPHSHKAAQGPCRHPETTQRRHEPLPVGGPFQIQGSAILCVLMSCHSSRTRLTA